MGAIEIMAIVLLAAFAVTLTCVCAIYGVPDMVSDCYYMMGKNMLVPLMLVALGLVFLPLMLERGGVECMAFLTCAGLMFVGAAPAYLDGLDRKVHKAAAIIAAVASVAWAVSVSVVPTVAFAAAAGVFIAAWPRKWLFWAEVAAVGNVAATTLLT